ncbi:DUF4186 domain-containing protein [Hyphomicrobium sp.]|uniref:DUF4186 domain-containing protein n=1 Tax=Hyphomicrobium sp. TaxID=82 RepID=UPI002E33E1CE|nr:DUF4186 domain-containing protein [Hyphomicrobium sp.]HEX2841803.1 DUF4186 domain-containing protein [Hyphomicrobium sp.]
MKDIDEVLAHLSKSAFRQRFALQKRERDYLESKGLPAVLEHGQSFIAKRLAIRPSNDGKQTPFRGHPVFVAQHATATCCRGCLAKWHDIPGERALDDTEQRYVLAVIERWLTRQADGSAPREPRLL